MVLFKCTAYNCISVKKCATDTKKRRSEHTSGKRRSPAQFWASSRSFLPTTPCSHTVCPVLSRFSPNPPVFPASRFWTQPCPWRRASSGGDGVNVQRKGGIFTECCRRGLVRSALWARVHGQVVGTLSGPWGGGLCPALLHQQHCANTQQKKGRVTHTYTHTHTRTHTHTTGTVHTHSSIGYGMPTFFTSLPPSLFTTSQKMMMLSIAWHCSYSIAHPLTSISPLHTLFSLSAPISWQPNTTSGPAVTAHAPRQTPLLASNSTVPPSLKPPEQFLSTHSQLAYVPALHTCYARVFLIYTSAFICGYLLWIYYPCPAKHVGITDQFWLGSVHFY